MATNSVLSKLHRRLIPKSEPMQFAPYVWLVYLSIFFVSLYFYQATPGYLWQVIVAMGIFFWAYFHGYQSQGIWIYIDILAIMAVGTWMAYITPGASVFFVYAGAFVCRLGPAKKAFQYLMVIMAYIGVISWLMNLHPFFYFPALLFTLLIGGLNIFQYAMDTKQRLIKLSQDEIRALASTAERERIARDLHDTMGHTLSLLTRKSELASRLIEHDVAKAKHEINEVESIARDALGQIREVITGYRSSDLTDELAQAKYVLESNDIGFDYTLEVEELPTELSQELGVIIKELVTNVLKHTQATTALARVVQSGTKLSLYFQDNGQASAEISADGYGLQGMQERVAAFKGQLTHGFGDNDNVPQSMSGFWVAVEVDVDD